MKRGIYYKGKFVKFNPLQLKKGEKGYIVYEQYELESPDQPDTVIVEKTNEVLHESGAVIHYHLYKPAPQSLRNLLKSTKTEIDIPQRYRGLNEIVKAVKL